MREFVESLKRRRRRGSSARGIEYRYGAIEAVSFLPRDGHGDKAKSTVVRDPGVTVVEVPPEFGFDGIEGSVALVRR